MATIYVMAGPNGVGKTTFASPYLPEEVRQLEFVNALEEEPPKQNNEK